MIIHGHSAATVEVCALETLSSIDDYILGL